MPFTLPARYYTDPTYYAEELADFYGRMWVCAGRADQIPEPGDYFLRELAGESLILTRGTDYRVRTFYNVCRHRGTQLCDRPAGHFPGRVQCPYHGWSYGLDGVLLGAPHMSGNPDFHQDRYPLHPVCTELWDGHIFVNLDPQAAPLADQLGVLPEKFAPWRMEELRLGQRLTYQVAANWKLIVSNYNECLHCPVLHPMLNRLTDYLGADNEPPSPACIGGSMGFRSGAETMSTDGRRQERAYLPGLDAVQRQQVYYYAIYPNLLLSLHPDYMMTHTLWPKVVDHTEILCEFYFHPDELTRPDFAASDVIDFWDQTNREDWHISELSHAGIRSRAYRPGPYSTREELLHAFDEVVLARERARSGRMLP